MSKVALLLRVTSMRWWWHHIIQIPGSERNQARVKPGMSGLNSHPTPHPSHGLATMEQWAPRGAAVLSRSSPWSSALGGTLACGSQPIENPAVSFLGREGWPAYSSQNKRDCGFGSQAPGV